MYFKKMEKSISSFQYQKIIGFLESTRKENGITQTELSKLLYRPQSFVSKYESFERRLDIAEFLLISKTLKVHFDNILHLLKQVYHAN